MNKKYYHDILVSAQVNRCIFLVVYEPYMVLEGLQGVRFQRKIALQNPSQVSLKSILALHNMRKRTENINTTICYLSRTMHI